MAARARVMRIRRPAHQGIIMAVSTLRSRGGHDNRMVERGARMQGFPRTRMTCCTVTARRKILTIGRTDKSTCCSVVTADAAVMRICRSAYQRIVMTIAAAGRSNSYQ